MPTYSLSSLRIGAWNVDGLHMRIDNERVSKFDLPEFSNMFRNLDIFCLIETHMDSKDNVSLEGFHIQSNLRPRSAKSPKASGGLSMGVRAKILKGVTFMKPTNSEIMWLKLNKQFFGFEENIFICNAYISPIGSSYSNQRDDIFALLEADIEKYSNKGKCIILGDFNAKTGTQPDYIVNDNVDYLNINKDYICDTPLVRCNLDPHPPDAHGKKLLELCKNSSLRIVNGRKLGDSAGNFTCYNHIGSPSTIDYMLCSDSYFPHIEYFRVQDLTPFSIHCMISCSLKMNLCYYPDPTDEEMELVEQPGKFHWSPKIGDIWQKSLKSPKSNDELMSFMHNNIDVDNTEQISNNFYNLLNTLAKNAGLSKKNATSNKKKNKKCKKWYDSDCKTLCKKIKSLGRDIKGSPANHVLIHSFNKTKKQYKKLLDRKKNEFRNHIFKSIENLQDNNPKAFWRLYDELSDKNKEVDNPISPREW